MSTKSNRNNSSGRILYDARGVRIKQNRSSGFLRTLLFFVLPYLIINGIIFVLVTSTPSIDVHVEDTKNYIDSKVTFTVKSLLPVRNLEVSIDSEPLEYEKSGKTYTADLKKNGVLFILAESANGMSKSSFTDISMLDDTAPSIDESNCAIANGYLTFIITDSQSGVDYDSIYGIDAYGREVTPTSIDKSTGLVSMLMYTDSMELHFKDMVGNSREGTITSGYAGADGSEGEAAEGSEAEGEGTGEAAE